MLYGIFSFSVLLNVVLVWYSRRLVVDLSDISQEVEEVITDLKVYHNHVENIYNLETFYGDETLRALLEHSKAVSERVGNFTTLFSQIEDEEVTEGIEEEIDEQKEEQVSQEKKHVLYAGTRRRNN
jgi:hypothetical protein